MIERCTDPECEFFGKPLVDRGWGFTVCQSTRWYSEFYPGSENKPLPESFSIEEDTHAPTT